MDTIHNVIIIGSGPAGLTAAIYLARSMLNPLIIDGQMPGGQLMGTSYVENWPGEKHIMGPQLMINMREHAKSVGTQFLPGIVERVDFSRSPFTVMTDKKVELKCRAVIIATGASPLKLGCPGEDTYWGKGVSTCAVCDGAFYKDKKVVIVGGGDTAMEDASFLTKFTDDITIIHIKDALTASVAMQKKVVDNPKIKIIYSSTVTEIHGNNGHVTGVTIMDQKTQKQTKLETDGVFIAIGLKPNTAVFKGHLDLNNYGYIKLEGETKTSVPGVFAAGDVFDDKYRQAITAAGSGCKAALDAERYLSTLI